MEAESTLIIGFLVSVVVFFLLREVMCWYYKINRMIEIQERQQLLLTALCESQRIQDPDKKAEYIKKTLWGESSKA